MVEGDATDDAATVGATTDGDLGADAVDVEPGELAPEPGVRKPLQATAPPNPAVRGEAANTSVADKAADGTSASDTEAAITEATDAGPSDAGAGDAGAGDAGAGDAGAGDAGAGDAGAGDAEPGEGESGDPVTDEAPPTRSLRGRLSRLLKPAALAMAALMLSVLGVAAAALTSAPDDRGGVRAVTARLVGPLTHHRLPELVADLKPTGRKTHYVQVVAVVEVPEDAVPMLQEQEAPIIADVQMRLRDSDRGKLIGAEGAERMRREMTSIIDGRIAPHRVHAVLFTRFLLD